MASLARIALSLASSIEFPLATATPNLLLPEIEGFPNNRIWVSGSFSALSTPLNEISSELTFTKYYTRSTGSMLHDVWNWKT